MADEATIARLRRMTDLAVDDAVYTDELLSGYIDDLGLDGANTAVWREKAAKFAQLVDTTESGSSRSLSQLYKQAMEMAGGPEEEEASTTTGGSFTVAIERV